MKAPVEAIRADTLVRDAARILSHAQISGAAVVDRSGRWVGVFSVTDVLRWIDSGADAKGRSPCGMRTCAFQENDRLPSGDAVTLCTLAPGVCPSQSIRPTTGGRHVAVCLTPHEVLSDWQQIVEDVPADSVTAYMTTDIVSVEPGALLTDVARMMVDAHIHRVFVADEDGRPVGVVSATDVLAALAWQGLEDAEEADPAGD